MKKSSPFNYKVHRSESGVRVAEVEFSDPNSRNSFKVSFLTQFEAILKQAEKESDVLLFRAIGPVFCSGGNLRDHIKQGSTKSKLANRKISLAIKKLNELKLPTLAIVEGDVFGGGIELLSAFDKVVATPHVVFCFWQRRLGVTYGWGGGARLEKKLGPSRVIRAGLDTQVWTANQALHYGLVDELSSQWSIRENGFLQACRLGAHSIQSSAALKRRTNRNEQKLFEELWFGKEHKMALAKFNKL